MAWSRPFHETEVVDEAQVSLHLLQLTMVAENLRLLLPQPLLLLLRPRSRITAVTEELRLLLLLRLQLLQATPALRSPTHRPPLLLLLLLPILLLL